MITKTISIIKHEAESVSTKALYRGEKRKMLFIILTNLRKEGNAGNIKDLPYGALSIAKHNADIAEFRFLDLSVDEDYIDELRTEVHEKIIENIPDFIGISIMFDNAYWAIKHVIDVVRNVCPSAILVGGGPAISPIAASVVKTQDIDAVCFSEGELPIRDLLKAEDPKQTLESHKSWITKSSSNKEPDKTLLTDLDNVIEIDYSYVDVNSYQRKVSYNPTDHRFLDDLRSFPLITSRGCPFKCAFCWHSGEDDTSMRYASIDSIIKHLEIIVEKYGANTITIYDDMLLLPRARAKELFRRMIPFKFRIELPNGLSPTYMDEELVELMYLAGVRSVRLAIESGDDWVIKHLVNKPLKIYQVQPVVEALRKNGMWVVGFFVIGMPGETDEHRLKTKEMALKWGLDSAVMSIASPIKGSLLYEECVREGYISNDEFLVSGYLFGENVINTPEFSAKKIATQAYLMNLEVNFINFYRYKTGEYKVAIDYFNFIVNTYPSHAIAYYCLARAHLALGDHKKAAENLNIAVRNYKNSELWRDYFEYFEIDVVSEADAVDTLLIS